MHLRNIFLTMILPISIVVKQSVMKQVIAKYLTENVVGGGGVVATGRLCLVIPNFGIRVHLLSPVSLLRTFFGYS